MNGANNFIHAQIINKHPFYFGPNIADLRLCGKAETQLNAGPVYEPGVSTHTHKRRYFFSLRLFIRHTVSETGAGPSSFHPFSHASADKYNNMKPTTYYYVFPTMKSKQTMDCTAPYFSISIAKRGTCVTYHQPSINTYETTGPNSSRHTHEAQFSYCMTCMLTERKRQSQL